MIRVGGDYQAQIPEFKPGKLGGGAGDEGLGREDGACGEKYKRQMRFPSILNLGEHSSCFDNLLPLQKGEITTSHWEDNSSYNNAVKLGSLTSLIVPLATENS